MQQVDLHENGVMGDCNSILKVGSSCTLGCQEGFEFVDKMKRETRTHAGMSICKSAHTAAQAASSVLMCLFGVFDVVGTGPAGLGVRIKVPRHPYCVQSSEGEFMSELLVDVECVAEPSLLGVFIILVVIVLIPVRARAPAPIPPRACSQTDPTAAIVLCSLSSMLCAQAAIAAFKYFQQFAEYKKKVARGYTWDGKGNAISPAGERDLMDVEGASGTMEETSNPVAEGTDEYEMET